MFINLYIRIPCIDVYVCASTSFVVCEIWKHFSIIWWIQPCTTDPDQFKSRCRCQVSLTPNMSKLLWKSDEISFFWISSFFVFMLSWNFWNMKWNGVILTYIPTIIYDPAYLSLSQSFSLSFTVFFYLPLTLIIFLTVFSLPLYLSLPSSFLSLPPFYFSHCLILSSSLYFSVFFLPLPNSFFSLPTIKHIYLCQFWNIYISIKHIVIYTNEKQ